MSDEHNNPHERVAELRGFKPFKRRTVLKRGNTVYFDGSEYRVIVNGNRPVLEKVVTKRKGHER